MSSWLARVAKAFVHLTLDPWVGLTALIIVTVGTSMAAGLAITVFGGALSLVLTLWLLDRFASFERARARLLLGIDVVSLGMTLGLARQKMATDPAQAEALLAEAHTDAKEAMAELRAIARGIHPAILDDRGLNAAVSALAARCPVPVTVTVELPRRLPRAVESAAYYVIAEALTNVAKHAGAQRAVVDVRLRGEQLLVSVSDDGKGGALASPDGGLAGLADRLRALGGALTITSPPGGPTTLTAELPDE